MHFFERYSFIKHSFQLELHSKSLFHKLIAISRYETNFDTPAKSHFLRILDQKWHVTQWRWHIWQTVQNHISGQNLFMCGRIWNLGIPNFSVWHWGKLKCIWRVWMKVKTQRDSVTRKIGKSHNFFSKPNKTCNYYYCKWWFYIISNQLQQPALQINLILVTQYGDGTDLRRSPHW